MSEIDALFDIAIAATQSVGADTSGSLALYVQPLSRYRASSANYQIAHHLPPVAVVVVAAA